MTTRRKVLLGGGALFVVVAGGAVWRAADNGAFSVNEGTAFEPWKNWRDRMGDAALDMVRAGILAANPHNTQPWLFRVAEDRIELFAATNRHLGAFDPYLREMHIGLGCCIENMIVAGSAYGRAVELQVEDRNLRTDARAASGPQLVATLDLTPSRMRASPLFEMIGRRHTDRYPYDTNRPLPDDWPQDMSADGAIIALFSGARQQELGQLIVEATENIISDHQMAADSAAWFRFTRDLVDKHRDGVSLDTAGLPPFIDFMARVVPAPSQESSDQNWLASTRDKHVATAATLGTISVADIYSVAGCVQAGRTWQELHLRATLQGISLHPLNQPLEMVDRERQLGQPVHWAERLTPFRPADMEPTFVFRAGWPTRPPRLSPKRDIKDMLLT